MTETISLIDELFSSEPEFCELTKLLKKATDVGDSELAYLEHFIVYSQYRESWGNEKSLKEMIHSNFESFGETVPELVFSFLVKYGYIDTRYVFTEKTKEISLR